MAWSYRYGRLAADDDLEAERDLLLRLPTRHRTVYHGRSRQLIIAVISVLGLVTIVIVGLTFSSSCPETEWRTFLATPIETVNSNAQSTSLLSQRLFDLDCADRWIANGELCEELRGKVGEATRGSLDIVWTWVNGSSPILLDWREALKAGSTSRSDTLQPRAPPKGPVVDRHLRSHNELRYSMRSTLGLFPSELRRRVLLTSDVPSEEELGYRIGQKPRWLMEDAGIDVVHHWSAFRTDHPPAGMTAVEWREEALPTFDSLAIETQLGHLDTAETILYANDDSFVGSRDLHLADLATPLYGPVLRLQHDLLVEGNDIERVADDTEGEWPSLRYTNNLLDARFGVRLRPYVAHVSKVFLRPILREIESVWPEEFAQTALQRFRGRPGVHVSFLATHYMIERHREALLWSFLHHQPYDRAGLLHYLCASSPASGADLSDCPTERIAVGWPTRTTLNATSQSLMSGGLATPADTTYDFASADGYPLVHREVASNLAEVGHTGGGGGGGGMVGVGPPRPLYAVPQQWPDYRSESSESKRQPTACHLPIESCFPLNLTTPSDVLRHVAFTRPECGDCLVVAVLRQSGPRGLDAFLPTRPTVESDAPSELPLLGGQTKTWKSAEYGEATRPLAVRLLQRYSYILGNSHSRFVPLRSANFLSYLLDGLTTARDSNEPPAFIVLNDDVVAGMDEVDQLLGEWMEKMWPRRAPWELSSSWFSSWF